jgi:hypothetical protein
MFESSILHNVQIWLRKASTLIDAIAYANFFYQHKSYTQMAFAESLTYRSEVSDAIYEPEARSLYTSVVHVKVYKYAS